VRPARDNGAVRLPLPDGDFRAYLFDCDGTITDSMPAHYRAWTAALGEWGCEFPEDLFYAWGGRTVVEIIEDLNARQGLAMPVAAVASRRETLFQESLGEMRAVPGVLAHIEEAYARVPFAVVSGSTRASVTASLAALDLLDRFPVLVCAGDYTKPKPDPEAYLLAALLLDVPPAECLVFEDTDLGIQAATAAGMAAVRVPPPWMR
jgi:beta-phosphoglucomutase-like phosphatase (HAD superfamily)